MAAIDSYYWRPFGGLWCFAPLRKFATPLKAPKCQVGAKAESHPARQGKIDRFRLQLSLNSRA